MSTKKLFTFFVVFAALTAIAVLASSCSKGPSSKEVAEAVVAALPTQVPPASAADIGREVAKAIPTPAPAVYTGPSDQEIGDAVSRAVSETLDLRASAVVTTTAKAVTCPSELPREDPSGKAVPYGPGDWLVARLDPAIADAPSAWWICDTEGSWVYTTTNPSLVVAPAVTEVVIEEEVVEKETIVQEVEVTKEVIKEIMVTATPEPTEVTTTEKINILPGTGTTLTYTRQITGTVYAWVYMDTFEYVWPQDVAGTDQSTPDFRDGQSTGEGETHEFDIGVNVGEFGVAFGTQIEFAGMKFGTGNPKGGCALVAFSPGFYREVTVLDGRWEVYFLPASDPRDWSGWSKVLASQAADKEHDLYGCPNKALSKIVVLYSQEPAPFKP